MTIEPPLLRAVALLGPVTAPKYKECPVCYNRLEYWRSNRGYEWICMTCHKRLEDQS